MPFCYECGTQLVPVRVEDKDRQRCPACGYIHYPDPKVTACTIPTLDGKVVLLRRAFGPGRGKWVFPGGYMDRGETVEEAACRETREEVNLEVQLESLLGAYSYRDSIVVVVVYRARVVGGSLRAGPESSEVRTFAPSELPWEELAFASTREALRDWVETQPGAGR